MPFQTNYIRCTNALRKRIEATGEKITPDQIGRFSMKHKGVCYRNSKVAPAVAEEHQAVLAARDLLLDADGNYLGDDQAVFCGSIHADNDTRAPSAFI